MIIKNLKLNHNTSVAKLSLGRQGEHGAACVEIDVGDFREKFGSGRAELLFCPPYESESFPVPMSLEDDLYKWEIGESVTHKAGVGMATLRWYVGDVLAKSCSIECYVQSSADGKVGEMPDVVRDWLANLLDHLPQEIRDIISEKADSESVYTKEQADAKTLEFGLNALAEVEQMLSNYYSRAEINDIEAARVENITNALSNTNYNLAMLRNDFEDGKKEKVIGMYGSTIARRVFEVVGIPEYIGENAVGNVNGYNLTETGWYVFARIEPGADVYVSNSVVVDGVEDYRQGENYVDVAVRFGTNGETKAITVNWNGSGVDTYLISATDLAIRNLDYRSTYRVYDIGDCLSFTTSGTKKAVFQNLTRNIVYAVDAIDCPMVVHLPEVSTESFGTWIELRVELTTSTNVSLEFIPPGDTKLSGTNVNVPKEGLNIIMAQYHEKMNTWFISNTVWNKPK